MFKELRNYNFSDWSYLLLMAGLILAGTNFSKFQVLGPLYLHDLILVCTAFTSLYNFKFRLVFLPIMLLLAVSLLYLVYSLFTSSIHLEITIRQYSIFGYLFLFYLLFNSTLDKNSTNKNVNTIKIIAVFSIISQVGYIIFLYVSQLNLNVFSGYNYLSSGVVFGLVAAASYVLIFINRLPVKLVVLAIIVFLSFTTGHSSAFLATFFVAISYLLLLVTPKSRVIIIALAIISILSMVLFLPQFQDANASWRLLLWGHTIRDSILNNWAVLGNGFGVPYVSEDFAFTLYKKLGSTGFFDSAKPYESYLSAMHNSFITMVFSVGLIPTALIFTPFIKLAIYFSLNREKRNRTTDFLALCLIGSTIWVSFNVILELPHSTGIYWFVYFSSWHSLQNGAK